MGIEDVIVWIMDNKWWVIAIAPFVILFLFVRAVNK